tara:strand:- start:125 stop:490 length:366 start_codon:yes stop_codon:yes gene_type:complete
LSLVAVSDLVLFLFCLISTFYIPEAKANLTLFEYKYPNSTPVLGGRKYALKMVTKTYTFSNKQAGKFLMKRVGSGNTFCASYIYNRKTLATFIACVAAHLKDDAMSSLIEEYIDKVPGKNW